MRWSVYKAYFSKKGKLKREPLGYVNALHSVEALERAWRRWPKKLDNTQVQRGLSVRPYANDYMELGKKFKK